MKRLIVLLGVLAATPARADQTYRVAVGATDVISGAAFATGIQMDVDTRPGFAFAAIGLAGMALGAPAIHTYEGNYARALLSVGSRVLFPTIGLVVVTRTRVTTNTVLLGFLAGFAVATAIDVAIAYGDKDPMLMSGPTFRF